MPARWTRCWTHLASRGAHAGTVERRAVAASQPRDHALARRRFMRLTPPHARTLPRSLTPDSAGQAEESVNEVLKLQPDNAKAHHRKGQVSSRRNSTDGKRYSKRSKHNKLNRFSKYSGYSKHNK